MYFLYLCLTFLPLFFSHEPEPDYRGSINAVIGYESATGLTEDQYALLSEDEKIRRHLAFVLGKLRAAPDEYPAELSDTRQMMISLLEEYVTLGAFPVNEKYLGRRPCFIDDDGNICAVGYLVQQTAGDHIARNIDKKHRYDYIADMDMEVLDNWIASSGLSRREVAMIQPSYDFDQTARYIAFEPVRYIRNSNPPFSGIALGYYTYHPYWGSGGNGYWRYWGLQTSFYEDGYWSLGAETESVFYGLKQTPLYATTGIQLNYLAFEETGLQTTPNAGIALRWPRLRRWSGMLLFSYGYDIPLINQDLYPYNRHRFELGLRMGVRI
jgi:hypothetical protein